MCVCVCVRASGAVLCFMFMLNFIIAIICESYLKVTAKIRESEADQEFFTDLFSVLVVSIKSCIWRWPGHMEMISALKPLRTKRVNYIDMRTICRDMKPHTLSSFMAHYRSFEPIRRRCPQEQTELSYATRQMIQQLSVMRTSPPLRS